MLIELKNIIKTYSTGDDAYQALRGISLGIDKGEMVAIMGPSGSGKSTTMHILGALDTPTSGQYLLNGKNIESYTDDQLADIRNKEIGFVFQSFNLLPRTTVYENIELPLIYANVGDNEREERVNAALESVGIKEKADRHSNQISGGQIQRVAIARAIITHPSLVLADEPTGNLDTKNSLEIMKIFQEMNNAGNTIVLITHEPEIAQICKRIITLRDGQIIDDKLNKNRTILK
jgi:putative ABC transport system ATP-binding protein